MIKKKFMMGSASLVAALTLSACGGADEEAINPADPEEQAETTEQADEAMEDTEENGEMQEGDDGDDGHGGHDGMDHSSSGEVPDDLAEAENPTYAVDDTAIIQADHMPGMDGATATIVGAYDTTAYSISYTPTDGGTPVENHKWVIHEELEDAQDDPYAEGDAITLDAEHMMGMEGASAAVDSVEQTTVYMVDFEDTETGEEIVNHKWVTESELTAE
ncbi:MAG: YdhK family protein [Bacillota bacterium]